MRCARALLRGARVTQYPCAGSGGQSGLQNHSEWFESICALAAWCNGEHSGLWILEYRFKSDGRCVSFVQRKGQGTSNPLMWVQNLHETSGYVAKRLCTGLLTRDKQVRLLSYPFLWCQVRRFDNHEIRCILIIGTLSVNLRDFRASWPLSEKCVLNM